MVEDAETVSKLGKLFHALLASTAPELDPAEQAVEIYGRKELGSGARKRFLIFECPIGRAPGSANL